MKRVMVSKAQAIGSETVPDTHIIIEIPVEDVETIKEAVCIYNGDSERLFQALKYALPGGTFDRLLAKMLTYKASHFIIPFGTWKED